MNCKPFETNKPTGFHSEFLLLADNWLKTTLNVVIAAGSEHCAAGGKGGESAVQDRLLHAHPLPTLGHGQDPPLEGFLPPRSSDFVTKCLNTKTTKHIPLHLLQTWQARFYAKNLISFGTVHRVKSNPFWSPEKVKLAELMYIEYFKNVIFHVTEEKIKRITF